MVFTLEPSTDKRSNVVITWEALPENFVLEEEPVESTAQPLIADTDGNEYSAKPTFPPGKWYFYEQILRVPIYITFEPVDGMDA